MFLWKNKKNINNFQLKKVPYLELCLQPLNLNKSTVAYRGVIQKLTGVPWKAVSQLSAFVNKLKIKRIHVKNVKVTGSNHDVE